jgi:chromosome segregation ATPase
MVSSSLELPEGEMSEARLQRIEEKIDILVSGQIDLGMRVTRLEEGQAELRTDVTELRTDVTELRGNVMQIAEGHAAHTRQIERRFQQLHAALDQRLRPLEDTVREHSAVLKRNRLS